MPRPKFRSFPPFRPAPRSPLTPSVLATGGPRAWPLGALDSPHAARLSPSQKGSGGCSRIATHIRLPGSGATNDLVLREWLAMPLTALDGRAIGSIHLVTESEAGFTGLHEAVLQHIAQMGAAAIERSLLYSRTPR